MKVYLVSFPMIYEPAYLKFLEDEKIENAQPAWDKFEGPSSGEILPEIAGRLCYMSFTNPRPGRTEAYLKHILEVGHGSVVEHSNYGFIITGISRSCSHELVRHRMFSYSQLSQRYVDSPTFVRHPDLNDEEWALLQLENQGDANTYAMLRNKAMHRAPAELTRTEQKKFGNQIARTSLPNNTETKIFMTGNVRAWRGMIEQRGSKHAEPEIRNLAFAIWKELCSVCPLLFNDYRWAMSMDDSTPLDVITTYKKI